MTKVRLMLAVVLAVLAILTTTLSVMLLQLISHFEAGASFYFSFLFTVLMKMLTFWASEKVFLLKVKQKEARLAVESEVPELYLVTRRLCQNARLPMPEIYVTPSLSLDIFIGGENPRKSVVVITKGLLKLLNRAELEGMLAHELARIKHWDVRVNIIVTLLSYLTAISPIFWAIEFIAFPDLVHLVPDWTVGAVLIMIGAAFYFVPGILKAAERRNSKYQFDAAAVRMAGTNEGLISALLKLEQSAFAFVAVKIVYFKACDLSGNVANPPPGSILGKLFGTHPPITDRVQKLRAGGASS